MAEASDALTKKRIGALIVSNDGAEILGIISERDIVRALAASGDKALAQPVAERMSKAVITCAADDSIAKLMSLMTEKRIRHLPVLNGGKLGGMISIGDVVKFRLQEVEAEADAMRELISGR